MDEDIAIINTKTRNEKIKSFFVEYKKFIIISLISLILIILGIYSFNIYKEDQRKKISIKYNDAIIEYKKANNVESISLLKEVISKKDSTYAPLALYFLIDNNLLENKDEVNELFDILLTKTPLEYEIENLIIFKKALYNADSIEEAKLLEILNPLINSKSVWKSHALYLVAEYFYSKNEKEKAKEFFTEIINLEDSSNDIKLQAQKRLNRDLSD